jgi:hypothetical protein
MPIALAEDSDHFRIARLTGRTTTPRSTFATILWSHGTGDLHDPGDARSRSRAHVRSTATVVRSSSEDEASGAFLRAPKVRIAALLDVIRSGALIEPDLEALWNPIETDYHANQRVIVDRLDEKQALRPDLDVDRATDIVWTLNHPNVWQLLVGERGWTPEHYEQWCADLACSQLLKHPHQALHDE